MAIFGGVPVFNDKYRMMYKRGGYVKKHRKMTKEQLDNDSVKAILQPGELVIPITYKGKEIVDDVIAWLKSNNIHLPNT